MLNKNNKPSWEEFYSYCGRCKELLIDLDAFIMDIDGLDKLIRFPYGNKYGWGIKYSKKISIFAIYLPKKKLLLL